MFVGVRPDAEPSAVDRAAGERTQAMAPKPYTSERIILAYLLTNGLFTLATSLIWAINTIFLMQRGGMTIFQVMLLNSIFLVAQMFCEVPTGVIADTIGRRASYLLAIATIGVSTLIYVAAPLVGWGFAGFAVGSAILGLGFTFQTGAVDAWMVDALDATGYAEPKERVFARGQMAFGAALLVGSLLGGFLGQIDLVIPYLARAAVLVLAFILVLLLIHDEGFVPRPLKISSFGTETRKIFSAGVRYGWGSRVVRPLLFVSLVTGVTGMYAFYSWQPYLLGLLGRNAVWLLGVVQAGSSLAMILGNALVPRFMRRGGTRRDAAKVLAVGSLAIAGFTAAIALVGVVYRQPGLLPAAVAITLWVAWSVVFGVTGPIRSGFINEHIPSAQRATVLSLDSLFGDTGGALGTPVLGWVTGVYGYPAAWLIGAGFYAASAPLYLASSSAVAAERESSA